MLIVPIWESPIYNEATQRVDEFLFRLISHPEIFTKFINWVWKKLTLN